MVFESIVAYFLDKYLTNYLDNFDSSKLKIGIWSGDVVLENLYLKPNALDELNLPIKVVFGHLKKMTLKIPWKGLYKQSVKVSIDGLTVLVAPKSSMSYDPEAEKKELHENKLKELQRLVDLDKEKDILKKTSKATSGENENDTFTERLQMQILRNLELQISNIHLRYEDDFSKPEHPFAMGVTLDSIEIKTTDENWVPTFLKEDKIHVNKLVSLISLAVYCNSEENLMNKNAREIVIPRLQEMTSGRGEAVAKTFYVLEPMSLSTKAVLNMRPREEGYKTPMFDITITLESIGVTLNRLQYFDLVDMLNTIDYMILSAKYRKYKKVGFIKEPKQLWIFAYTAINESQIRPKIEQFRWENIKQTCETRRNYIQILRKKLKKGTKLTPEEKALESKYEQFLDVFNLALARKQAEVEHARIVEKEKEEVAKSSWWNWASGGAVAKADKDKISEAIELSREEKAKLFDAIGYTGEESYSEYPANYVNWKVRFILKKFVVSLKNGEYKTEYSSSYVSRRSIVRLAFEGLEMSVLKRPVNNGLRLNAVIRSVRLTGSSLCSMIGDSVDSEGDVEPVLVEPDLKDSEFMRLEFEQELESKRVVLKSKSLQLTYNAITVNNIVYFFESTKIKQTRVKDAALKKISQAKERSILFMKNNLQNINQIDLNIDVQPSYLVIPENGTFSECSKSICINFGHFSMKSESNFKPAPVMLTSLEEDETFVSANEDEEHCEQVFSKQISPASHDKDVIQASYYKFQIDLKNMQVLLIDNRDAFDLFKQSLRNPMGVEQCSQYYILTPLDLFFNIHQCVYTDDVQLPAWKIFGNLPLISTELTDRKLENLIHIATSIPLPTSPSVSDSAKQTIYDLPDEPDNAIESLSSVDVAAVQKCSASDPASTFIQQAVTLELSFEITQIFITLKEENVKYFDFVSFKISSFGTFLQVKTYDLNANIYLNYVECEYGLFNDTDGSRLYLISSQRDESKKTTKKQNQQRLVDIEITQTTSHSPTLALLHKNILTKIDVRMGSVEFVLNVVAFRNFLKFGEYFTRQLESIKKSQVNPSGKKEEKFISLTKMVHLKEEQIKSLIKKAKNVYKKSKNELTNDLVEIKLSASMAGVKARICTTQENYFQFNVNNLDVDVTNRITETNVAFILSSISLLDLQKITVHKQIVSLKENTDNLINVQLTIFKPGGQGSDSQQADKCLSEKIYFRNYMNENYFDLVVAASISKLRLMFFFKHLDILLGLINILTEPDQDPELKEQTTSVEGEEEEDEEEKENQEYSNSTSDSYFSFLYRTKLDVTVNAPIILLPYNDQAVLLDCGLITVQTNLEIVQNYFENVPTTNDENLNTRCQIPPLIEIQCVSLSNMEISRILLNSDLSILSDVSLVDCSDLQVTVRRNLQPDIYSRIEALNVKANYNGLLASLSRGDYTFLIEVLQSFGEKEIVKDSDFRSQKKSIDSDELAKKKGKAKKMEKRSKKQQIITADVKNESILVKFDVKSIKIYLHDQETVLSLGKISRSHTSAFSKMELNTLKFQLNLPNNTSTARQAVATSFLLDNLILDDTRASNPKPIRLVQRYNCKQVLTKPMIYCSFEKKLLKDSGDLLSPFVPETRLTTTLSCLRVCINIDYLLLLHDFFVDGLPKSKNTTVIPSKDLTIKEDKVIEELKLKLDEQRLFCDIRIENPQFILYENQHALTKSNCLVIDGLIYFNLRSIEKKTKIYMELSDLMIKLKSFRKRKYESRASYLILAPTTLNFTGLIDNDEQVVDSNPDKKQQAFTCDLQEVNLNMCPAMLSTSMRMLNSVQASISRRFGQTTESSEDEDDHKGYSTTWTSMSSFFSPISFRKQDFWFTQEKTDGSLSSSSTSSDLSIPGNEDQQVNRKSKSEVLIRTGKVLIKLESGVSEQIPLIALSITLNGEYSNWTFSPMLSLKLNLEMSYFNEALSGWEPIIEPVADDKEQLRPYELFLDMVTLGDETRGSAKKGISEIEKHMNNIRVERSFQIHSDTSLQFVVTKTFLGLIDTVGRTLSLADEEADELTEWSEVKEDLEMEEDLMIEKVAQERKNIGEIVERLEDEESEEEENLSFNFLIKNELGLDVMLESLFGFMFYNFDVTSNKKDLYKIELKNNHSYPIQLRTNFTNTPQQSQEQQEHIGLQDQHPTQDQLMKFKLDFNNGSIWKPHTVTVSSSTTNAFHLAPNNQLMLCETATILDKRRIRLRSPVQVINTLEFDVLVSYPCTVNESVAGKEAFSSSSFHWADDIIHSGKKWCLPLTTLQQNKVDFFRVCPLINEQKDNKTADMQIINWRSKVSHKLLSFNMNNIFIQVLIERDPVNVYSSSLAEQQDIDVSYNILLLPTVKFNNYLPYTVRFKVDSNVNTESRSLHAGESVKLYAAKIGASNLLLELVDYAGTTWYSSHLIEFNSTSASNKKGREEETDTIEFRSNGKLVTLCYNSVLENSCLTFSLYAPYWVINQTRLKLDYKFKGFDSDFNEIDAQCNDQPFFFRINPKLLDNPGKKLSIRVQSTSDWSQDFLIDAVGNTGTILCKPDKQKTLRYHEIGVDIRLSSNQLTKIIKLTPYYLLVNSSELTLDVVEVSGNLSQRNEPSLLLPPNSITPFWPIHYSANKNNSIRIIPWLTYNHDHLSSSDLSQPFWYDKKHSSVLTFKDNIHTEALYVECVPTEKIIRTIIRPYVYGNAPVLVVNCLRNQPLSVRQSEETDEMFLMPEQYLLKTWKNPTGKRQLTWSCGLSTDQVYNLDTIQSTHKFQVTLSRDAYCLSFLDGLQKVLMFVDRLGQLNDEVVGFKEITGDEFLLSLNSFGLTLIDDRNKTEVLYVSCTSSSINWGQRLDNKVKVFKAFPTHQIERIEAIYQEYLLEVEAGTFSEYKTYMLDKNDEVDFSRMVMYTGKKEIPMQRHFAPSLCVNCFKSVNQTNLHLMVHKLQIDNQLYGSVFPVVFSKVLPPKSVASSTIVKPILEMSMVQSHSQRTLTSEVKYFKILMQEFSVKVDIIFLNTLAAFFLENLNSAKKYMHDTKKFIKEINDIKRSFHDLFHYSSENFTHTRNEKLFFDLCHISPIKIHLSFSIADADAFKNSSLLLDNPFFKSISLMLTDMQDVVFKLGYFEIVSSAYSWQELISEATVHYKTQIIKQGYILVLGLDVLGNPFGLIRGLAEGVESLFYEPYAGFVQGPGEFAEGVALGIGKLFGNTVGGAAGAFSKITGTLGKGLATLSFDKDFQKTRQKQAEAKSSFLQNIGQNLVMGVVSGVTGIVEKPIEGGKKGGAVGVLSGIGKGLLGVVTKPTAGLVDFTSQSLEGIRKVAVQEESVNRVRPPRRIYRLVTPYRFREAQCVSILRDLEKGRFSDHMFVVSLDISKDPQLILIATNRALMLVKDNYVFGNQSCEWVYEYGQLQRPIELVGSEEIRITTVIVEKHLFAKDRACGQSLKISDLAAAKKFVLRVNKIMSDRA